MGHEVNADAPMLAGLGGTLVYIILTTVTSVAGWTLQRGRDRDLLSPEGRRRSPWRYTESQGKGAHAVIPRTDTCPVSRNTHPVHGSTRTQRATDNTQRKETHIQMYRQSHRRNTQIHPSHTRPETHTQTLAHVCHSYP